jgi:hypothetical protein
LSLSWLLLEARFRLYNILLHTLLNRLRRKDRGMGCLIDFLNWLSLLLGYHLLELLEFLFVNIDLLTTFIDVVVLELVFTLATLGTSSTGRGLHWGSLFKVFIVVVTGGLADETTLNLCGVEGGEGLGVGARSWLLHGLFGLRLPDVWL